MCILSFLLNFRHNPPPPKKKIRLGDEIGINIILKSSNGEIHRFFDCLGIRSTMVYTSQTEIQKNMTFICNTSSHADAFLSNAKKAKTSFE